MDYMILDPQLLIQLGSEVWTNSQLPTFWNNDLKVWEWELGSGYCFNFGWSNDHRFWIVLMIYCLEGRWHLPLWNHKKVGAPLCDSGCPSATPFGLVEAGGVSTKIESYWSMPFINIYIYIYILQNRNRICFPWSTWLDAKNCWPAQLLPWTPDRNPAACGCEIVEKLVGAPSFVNIPYRWMMNPSK